MSRTRSTVVTLSTVAALLAGGGAAAAVATTADDPGAEQAVEHSQAQEAKKAEKQQDRKDRKGGKDGKRKHKRIAKQAPKGDGAKVLCKRAPKIDKRIDKIQRRLDGGLRTRGSIDRLEKRVENARKAGHGPVADFLNGRLEDRRGHKGDLKDREDDLKKLRAFCATFEKNEDGGKSSGESAEN